MVNLICKRFVCGLLIIVTVLSCCTSCVQQNAATTTPSTTESPLTTTPLASTSPESAEKMVEEYEALMSDLDEFPLVFKYDEKEFSGFDGFEEKSRTTVEIKNGSQTNIVLRHPEINASFELITYVYPSDCAYEYVVYIHNDSEENTGVISELGFSIEYKGDDPVLKGIKGDANNQYYKPYSHDMTKKLKYTDRSTSGRPTHGTFPYYNLSYDGGGTFIAIGWPGTWRAEFVYDKNDGATTLEAGQLSVASYIAPGETMRTPLMGFVEYKGLDEDEQTNAWRHYYINDVMREIEGELTPTYAGISYGATGMTTSKTLLTIKSFLLNRIKPELLWIDAGWYTGVYNETVSWPAVGTHNVNTSRYPDKMADIGALTAENDMEFLLWFEPEIVRLDRNAFLNYHKDFDGDWLLTINGTSDLLVNLGDPECRQWVLKKICGVMDTAGVTAYRQDFNTDPATGWSNNDKKTPNRTGMTENLYVQGYLALWDALIEKYPDIYIDSCASGGGRNDLESMKRGVPLHYSDYFDVDSQRNDYEMKSKMTQALYAWLPYFKNEIYKVENTYQTRMNLAPLSLLNVPNALDPNAPWELLRQAYAEHDSVEEYFYADYYQLTEWTTNKNRWNGWEFFDPATNSGIAFMFCHETTLNLKTTVKLKGLDENVKYKICDADGLVNITATGKQLMEKGFSLTVPEKPYGALIMISPAE